MDRFFTASFRFAGDANVMRAGRALGDVEWARIRMNFHAHQPNLNAPKARGVKSSFEVAREAVYEELLSTTCCLSLGVMNPRTSSFSAGKKPNKSPTTSAFNPSPRKYQKIVKNSAICLSLMIYELDVMRRGTV